MSDLKKTKFFTGRPYATIKSVHDLKVFKKDKIVGDLDNQRNVVIQNFIIKEWLSNNA
jgi:hypothetical protein